MTEQHYDIAIIGGGPAGLQAALILARTRKRVIIFDAPEPPRNAASHGVHNFVGLDGLLPAQIREQAWQQIDVYNSAERRIERIIDVQANAEGGFDVSGEAGGTPVTAKHVIVATGFRDVYPDVPGYLACWGKSIIACPFCDGYENRDRVWGLVITSLRALEHLPILYQHWTKQAKIILHPDIAPEAAHLADFAARGIPVHMGKIVEVHHTSGEVNAVTLDSGEQVEVGTLLWTPPEQALPLTQKLIANFGLDVDENDHLKTDAMHQTAVKGLWAVGDIQGWASSLGAAFAGSQAAYAIIRDWYPHHNQEKHA